jgi:hypothetical protein
MKKNCDALSADGALVFGWDLEWNMNYAINRYCTDLKSADIL